MKSKSSLHDILSGRRKASLETLESIIRGLKIPSLEKKLVRKLWEDADEKEIQLLQRKISLRSSKASSKDLPLVEGWDYVYASLGDLKKGNTLQEVSKISGLKVDATEKVLKNLLALGIVERSETDRYRALALHTLFESDSDHERRYLVQKVTQLHKSISNGYGKRVSQFSRNFVFSIPEKSYPKLRSKLRALLDEFADESEEQTGTKLVELFVSFQEK